MGCEEQICKLVGRIVGDNEDMFDGAHMQLRGGSRPMKHCFLRRQYTVLESICDTIIPSLKADSHYNPSVAKFFALSASQAGIVPEVAGMLCAFPDLPQFMLIYMALFLLSTRLGTFFLCGFNSISPEFPYFQPFSALPLEKRERIFSSWSHGIFLIQMLYKVVKCYTVFKYFSRADEKGRNPAWEAMGYKVPELLKEHEERIPNILEQQLMDAKAPDFPTRLVKLGLPVVDKTDDDHLKNKDDTKKERQKCKEIGIKCDVVVVGSGSGGSVIAAQLSQKGYKVVVVEKGEYFSRRGLSLLEGPSMQAMYEQSGALTTYDGSAIMLTGTTLGGGSAVNWSASLRTPDHVLREWSEMGLERFAGEKYRNAMDAVCRRLGVQDACMDESFQNRVLRTGCTALGYPVKYIPRNAGKDHDCGFCGFGCPFSSPATRKQSTVDTWLKDAATAGAIIITGCPADRVLTTPSLGSKMFRCTGVRCTAGEYSLHVEAGAVVAACGSLFTPPLLRRSGLRNPHIGRHLSLHPVCVAWGYFPQENIFPGKSYEGGIMTSFCDVDANWDTTGYGSIMETPCIHPGNFSVLTSWRSGFEFKQKMLEFPRTANIIILDRDRGRGTVDERQGKLIINYPLFSADRQALVEGTKKALKLLIAAGAEKVGTACVDGDVFYTKEGDFEVFWRKVSKKMFQGLSTPILSAHQMGSCRMGVDPLTSAVDKNCETWEVEGLFVGDGSVFPTASGVNPMITIQSIAYCTANSISNFLVDKV